MLTTTVLKRGQPRFTMTGQRLPSFLTDTGQAITAGLTQRLHRYALGRLDEAGFKEMCQAWDVEVYTMDADDKPSDRSYVVRFKNEKGGYVELCGILTKSGWPVVDHGFEIGHE